MSDILDEDEEGEDYSDALPLGADLGDYEIIGYLGRGSFGITYRARETKLKRDVAIKEYMPREWARRFPDNSIGTVARKTSGTFHYGLERFTMEAQNLAACRQENIVKVHRLLEQNATSYMVMELLDGETLETRIVRAGRLPWTELAPIFRALLDGCRDIHRRGILHRDIKPANVVLRDLEPPGEAGSCQPVLIDFGAAREIRRQAGGQLSAILTEEYAPLEQWTGTQEQGPYTDIYALAATISHALTGTVPTMAPARMSQPPEPMTVRAAGLAPEDVLRALDHGLALNSAQRPQTVDEWLAEMPSLSGARRTHGAGEPDTAAPERGPINRRAVFALAGGAALTGVAAWLLLSRSDIGGSARPLRVDWARAYDPVGPNGLKPAVAIAPDGGALVAASLMTGDAVHMLAMKLDARGNELARWTSPEGYGQAFAVQPASGGGLFVGGGADMLADSGSVTSAKGLLVRLDGRLSQLWRTEFDGAILTSLIPQGRNELLAAFDGVNRSGIAMLQRVSENGQKRGRPIELNDRRGDSARKVIALPDGTLAVLGLRESGPASSSIWVSCVNADGRELWRASDSGLVAEKGLAWSEGSDLLAAANALFVVGKGAKAAIDTSEPDNPQPIHSSTVMRLDLANSGALRWLRADYEPDPSTARTSASARSLATTGGEEPNVYAAGWHNIPYQGWIRQLDGEGNVIWALEPLGPRGFAPIHLQLNDQGGYAVGLFNPDAQTAKLMVVRFVSG